MVRWLVEWFRNISARRHYEWSRVPPPNWRCSRGYRDTWYSVGESSSGRTTDFDSVNGGSIPPSPSHPALEVRDILERLPEPAPLVLRVQTLPVLTDRRERRDVVAKFAVFEKI
jgi:hypothetical protein